MTNDKFPMTNYNSGLRVKPAMTSLIEYGLYLLVFLLPLQTRWIIKAGATEYATYSLYGTDILLILLLLMFSVSAANSWIAGQARNDIISNDRMVYWFIGGLLLVSGVSVFFAASQPLALYKLGWLILGVGLFWLIIKADYSRLKLIYAMLAGIFFQAVLGIWQFLSQSSFANKWLGVALHNAADLGTSVIEAVGADGVPERWLRAYGGLDHPNMLGGLLAIGILLLIGKMIKLDKTINWVFLAVFTAALFFSFSRTAWLGLIIGLVIMMVLVIIGRNLKQQRGLAEIILVMGILLFVLFNQYQNLITSRLAGEGRLENKSTSERLVSYQESWQMIKKTPAFGVGLGNYTYALNRQAPGQPADAKALARRESFYYQPTHNVFMLVWSEVGIVGLLFFVALLFAIARSRRERSNFTYPELDQRLRSLSRATARDPRLPEYGASRNDKEGRGNDKRETARDYNVAIILIALVAMMFLDHWLFSLHFGVLFFWLVLGMIVSSERDKKSGFPPARE